MPTRRETDRTAAEERVESRGDLPPGIDDRTTPMDPLDEKGGEARSGDSKSDY